MAFFGFFSSPIIQVILIIIYSISFGTYSFCYFHNRQLSKKETGKEIIFSDVHKVIAKSDFQFINHRYAGTLKDINSFILSKTRFCHLIDKKKYILIFVVKVFDPDSGPFRFSRPPPVY